MSSISHPVSTGIIPPSTSSHQREEPAPQAALPEWLRLHDRFAARHLGPDEEETLAMLQEIGCSSIEEMINRTVPEDIRLREPLALPEALSETEALNRLRAMMSRNRVYRSFIGMGYANCLVPEVISRNILENPGWYTAYTPYQAEISQGRMEALLNFQTLVTDLTGLDVSNASLLDEATAAAEAMAICAAARRDGKGSKFYVDENVHPQTIAVIQTRAGLVGTEVIIGKAEDFSFDPEATLGVLVQYPDTHGAVADPRAVLSAAKKAGGLGMVAADLLALCLLKSPGELGADIAVGNCQRFGVPLGYGGPHAAYIAVSDPLKRKMPGRLIGVSKDPAGRLGYRLALQTREQHIRREKATSNICTAQVLLAVMSSMYAVYHGPSGLRKIAERVHGMTSLLAAGLRRMGHELVHDRFFDTLTIQPHGLSADEIRERALAARVNLRYHADGRVGITVDEATTAEELATLLNIFETGETIDLSKLASEHESISLSSSLPGELVRASPFLQHPVFNKHHSETELLRYIRSLEKKDLSLTSSMIALGSCTMKLNATAEMRALSWPEVNNLHPLAPLDQTQGYQQLILELEDWLATCTGFAAVSLQPNAGSQGEFAGLLAIRRFHEANGEPHRKVCLIPTSAHGTNPASAVMAGYEVVTVKCDERGDVDLADLRAKSEKYAERLGALMITYPSTHGVFEAKITQACALVHEFGGQVYMDGANMNAQLGLTTPKLIGADVCHLNLHKTFCIPHGGGGPGVGPIAVAAHLADFLPGHPIIAPGNGKSEDAIAAAPWGSASILTISWMYIAMMGPDGLKKATELAILNANYIAKRLEDRYPVLYRGNDNLVAHECILDTRIFEDGTGVRVEDIAKRLMDYGFHAPTMSWPVTGTMMIEPTESETKAELDRFCEAMISIHKEIVRIREGEWSQESNPLRNAPHTAQDLMREDWESSAGYSRDLAAYPLEWIANDKYWPPIGRIDNVYGDRNLFCTCPPLEETAEPVSA